MNEYSELIEQLQFKGKEKQRVQTSTTEAVLYSLTETISRTENNPFR